KKHIYTSLFTSPFLHLFELAVFSSLAQLFSTKNA
uniref:Uncharacterized protein n=1 Tax=Solanum lycopersicum TaxID=4081 RepID=A0A3Q7GQP0_SOLLC